MPIHRLAGASAVPKMAAVSRAAGVYSYDGKILTSISQLGRSSLQVLYGYMRHGRRAGLQQKNTGRRHVGRQ
ncbi:hypothetical protein PSEUDO9AG_70381 [Pseudomonas sp. 9Ag]|nr:hypothetical protein PSEUDO9AG_70381 [Pseudomonas sp. 9Ag]